MRGSPVTTELTAWRAAKVYWRYFIFIWLLPIAFFLFIFLPNFEKYASQYFFFLIAPVFFVSFWVSTTPVRRKEVHILHGIVWTIFAPFVVWVTVIGGFFALAFLLGA